VGDSQDLPAVGAKKDISLAENAGQPAALNFVERCLAMRADRDDIVSLFAGDHVKPPLKAVVT
jgi:hypothetical protein